VTGGAARRVCILGAESTGKTTLTKALATRYETLWVPEYGAVYHHRARGDPNRAWSADEFVHIAQIQNWLEDFLAGFARRVLFCDTDVFTTYVFAELYLGAPVQELRSLVRRYDLYVLCDPSTPFRVDPLALRREEARAWMHERYVEHVRSLRAPYIEVTGERRQRVEAAAAAVDALPS